MSYIPASLTRLGGRQLLKLRKHSPTIMVVGGVVGLGATAVMAAKATRKLDPVIDTHKKLRVDITMNATDQRDEQKKVVSLYTGTAIELGKLYGPTLIVGGLSAFSVLNGHRILSARHLATMAAYSGLMEQFQAYRARVSETLGPELERDIHNGAIGHMEEDPNHPGEYLRKSTFGTQPGSYLRPFFDEANSNWTRDPTANFLFLKGVQSHMNRILELRGYLFLSEVYEALGMGHLKTKETIVTGWLYKNDGVSDGFVDFGFMTDQSPEAVAFRNNAESSVRLNFNIDGVIWDLI
jgi:hypothetical protein